MHMTILSMAVFYQILGNLFLCHLGIWAVSGKILGRFCGCPSGCGRRGACVGTGLVRMGRILRVGGGLLLVAL